MADPTLNPPVVGSSFEELFRRLDEADRTLLRVEATPPEERRRILAERARSLAEVREQEQATGVLEVVAFRVGGERYAVPLQKVDEILEIRGLCLLFGAPRHVLGALVARSRVLPVFDLRALLGLSGGGMSDLTKVIALAEADELLGIAVEEVEGRLSVPAAELVPQGPFLTVTADRLAVLDPAWLVEPTPQTP
jgi:purine-binding chemotaxis protein CheW